MRITQWIQTRKPVTLVAGTILVLLVVSYSAEAQEARRAAETRAAQAEAELERLRAELTRLREEHP